ncbi:MAG: sensor histidine kinase [Actinobacteria bacterium]|nr:sensor histidine kinase [Actinomycetota bacterium]
MRLPFRKHRRPVGDPSVGGAVLRFALGGIAALTVVGVVTFLVLRDVGTNEALKNAREVTAIVGKSIVEPNLSPALVRGEPAALARFNALVHERVLRDPIVRIKIWTPGGRVVYSDARSLIGQRFELGADEVASLRTGQVDSGVSNLSLPENRSERGQGKLLEVYLPVRVPGGPRLLFEAYQHFSSVAASARSIWLAFLPALIVALIVLYLLQLPIAASMARRLRRGSRDREALLERAIDASSAERRRIASDLHDGVVQDLAGLSFNLAAAAERCEAEGDAAGAEKLRQGAEQARQGVRGLRSLLVEIYPPSLQQAGLASALSDLLGPVAARGIETSAEVRSDLSLPPDDEALIFRVAQEAVRNAVAHGQPSRVDLSVQASNGHVLLTVADDGLGFDPARAEGMGEGHFGLSMLRDLAREAEARLDVKSAPGHGTQVSLEVPRR